MEVVSTVDAWLRLAQLSEPLQRTRAWVEEYEAAFTTVFDTYYRAWGRRDRIPEAARTAPQQVEEIEVAEHRAQAILARVEKEFGRLDLLDPADLKVVLLVGQHTSNGWVTTHQGRTTLFIALELLPDPPFDEILIVHELSHVVQGLLSEVALEGDMSVSETVLTEGVATAVSRHLRPGGPDSAYLWFDDAHLAWTEECVRARIDIADLLDNHVDDSSESPAGQTLLTLAPGVGGVPNRSGYWCGDRIATDLLNAGASLRDLLSMSARQQRDAIRSWASANRGDGADPASEARR